MHKNLRGRIFADDRNPGFCSFIFLESTLELHMHCDCFENFKD